MSCVTSNITQHNLLLALVVVWPTLLILDGFRVWHAFEGFFISNSVYEAWLMDNACY